MIVIPNLKLSDQALAFECVRIWSICGHQWIPTATVFALSMFSPAVEIVCTTPRWKDMLPPRCEHGNFPFLTGSDTVLGGSACGTLGNNRCYSKRVTPMLNVARPCLHSYMRRLIHDECSRHNHQGNICGCRCHCPRLHTLEDILRVQDEQTN